MRDMPYIDSVIAGFCSALDAPNAAEQAIAFDQSLERSGWAIVPIAEVELRLAALDEARSYVAEDVTRCDPDKSAAAAANGLLSMISAALGDGR